MDLKKNTKKLLAAFTAFVFVMLLMPIKSVFALAEAAPNKPQITHNQWGTDVDGNYDITCSMWYGNNATSYKIYERFGPNSEFKVIKEGKLEDKTPSAQSIVTEVRGRKNSGTYYYYGEFTNSFGTTKTDTISVVVGSNGNAKIVIDKVDDNGVSSQFTINQETVSYKLANPKSADSTFKVISNNTSVAKAEVVDGNILKVTGISEGRSGLRIIDNKTSDERQIGVRVKDKSGNLPKMPKYLSVGQVSEDKEEDLNFWRDTSNDLTNKRTDIRYIYINGGPFKGWRSWTSEDGARAKTFINESLKMGMIPFFVYYNIPDNDEGYEVDLKHINDKSYIEGYFKDLKYFLDICKEYGKDETIGMIFEPDFLGYMMQQSNKSPEEIPALVEAAYSSGVLEKGKDPDFSNNVKGLVQAINYTVDKYYKEAYNGWQFNIWSYSSPEVPGQGILHKTEFLGWDSGRKFIKDVATQTANYYKSAGINSYGTDFISIDKYGLDGAYEDGAASNPKKSKWFWNADIWDNYLLYTKTLHEQMSMPAILWQIPVGHINNSTTKSPYTGGNFKELENKAGYYEDSATSYFFGDTFKSGNADRLKYFSQNEAKDPSLKVNGDTITWGSHMDLAKDSGIVSVLFGAGVGASTDAVGSPPTDDYFWITKAQEYYKNPLMLSSNAFDVSNSSSGSSRESKDLPLKPVVKGSNLESDGNYIINIEIPKDSKGKTYKLYENGKTVKSGDVKDSSSIEYKVSNKETGTYMYSADLINDNGTTSSSIVTINVKNNIVPEVVVPKSGEITASSLKNYGNYSININIPKESNGLTYELLENGRIAKSGEVNKASQNIKFDFTNKDSGEYIYKLIIKNKDGQSVSNEIKVTCDNKNVKKGVNVDFKIVSDWGGNANYDLTIKNDTGKDISNWELTFKSDKKITSNWNADLKYENGVYKITPKAWNSSLKNGEKISLGGACEGGEKTINLKDINVTYK